MNCSTPQVVFQEVPNHVALAFTINGCPLHCDGCHSQHTWQADAGEPLTATRFCQYIEHYQDYIDAVVFFGGEWHPAQLTILLTLAKQYQLVTCLYSGFSKLPKRITAKLDYLKLGAWKKDRGGLDNPNTNQQFIHVPSGACLNYLFQSNNNNKVNYVCA